MAQTHTHANTRAHACTNTLAACVCVCVCVHICIHASILEDRACISVCACLRGVSSSSLLLSASESISRAGGASEHRTMPFLCLYCTFVRVHLCVCMCACARVWCFVRACKMNHVHRCPCAVKIVEQILPLIKILLLDIFQQGTKAPAVFRPKRWALP